MSLSSGYQLTSYDAWESIQEKLPERRKAVFDCIFYSAAPMTIHDIAKALHWGDHCVSGRVQELAVMGYIEECGEAQNPSGCSGKLWRAVRSPFAPAFTDAMRRLAAFRQNKGRLAEFK
jgi:predicted ArsR family transcriptional regulator